MKIKCHHTWLAVPKHLVESAFKGFIKRMHTSYYFDMVFRKVEIKLPRKLITYSSLISMVESLRCFLALNSPMFGD